jgi:hypothetical protein
MYMFYESWVRIYSTPSVGRKDSFKTNVGLSKIDTVAFNAEDRGYSKYLVAVYSRQVSIPGPVSLSWLRDRDKFRDRNSCRL